MAPPCCCSSGWTRQSRDGDQVLAVIRGCAVNNDGSAKVGYTAPSVEGQAQVIARAQKMARGSRRVDHLYRGPWNGHAAGRSDRDRRADQGLSRFHAGRWVLRPGNRQGKCRPPRCGFRGHRLDQNRAADGASRDSQAAALRSSRIRTSIWPSSPFFIDRELAPLGLRTAFLCEPG